MALLEGGRDEEVGPSYRKWVTSSSHALERYTLSPALSLTSERGVICLETETSETMTQNSLPPLNFSLR
jgi:hypothetical protein